MGRKVICISRRRQQRPSPSASENVMESRTVQDMSEVQEASKRTKSDTSSGQVKRAVDEEEYKLALELLEFEKSGYLQRSNNEHFDPSLVQYGDRFGLTTLNEYPKFFMCVPQHPHYGETSLENVKAANAETYWDLFMPVMQRGLSAVRKNNKNEIAAVEHRITRFTEQGFDFRHLKAYINITGHLQANQASAKCELEKVKLEIEAEEKRIDHIISSKSIAERIAELEEQKQRYWRIIADIDSSLTQKQQMLEEEKYIRATRTTPTHDKLLKTKEELERKIVDIVNVADMLAPTIVACDD